MQRLFKPETLWAFPPPWGLPGRDLATAPSGVAMPDSGHQVTSRLSPRNLRAHDGRASSAAHPARLTADRQGDAEKTATPAAVKRRTAACWGDTPKDSTQLPHDDSERALVQLLNEDVRRGHRNLAIRHFLMLEARGICIPGHLRQHCEHLLKACPRGVKRQILTAVGLWKEMVQGAGTKTSKSATLTAPPDATATSVK